MKKYIFPIVLIIWSCSSKSQEEHEHDEAPANENKTEAVLTAEQMKTMSIQMNEIELKPISSTIKANGYLKVPTTHKGLATSLFGGVVKKLMVQIGDEVKKGQVIAWVENPQFLQVQEDYLALESQINFAEKELARQKELNAGGAGALKNLQSTESEIASLKSRRSAVIKRIEMMGLNTKSINASHLSSTIAVTAPISGTVSEVFAHMGSYIDVSTPVAEIVDNARLHLDLQIFEKDLPLVKVGQKIHFILTNNPQEQYLAEIHKIGSTFENASKTVAMHATVLSSTKGMIDGMSVTGLLNINGSSTTAVPNEAIINATGRYYIYVFDKQENNQYFFKKTEIIPQASDLGYTAISPIKPLAPNAKIVTKGAFFVHASLEEIEHD